jgi:hypothetical protein
VRVAHRVAHDVLTLCSVRRKEVVLGDDSKVLLARLGDKIHATPAFRAP